MRNVIGGRARRIAPVRLTRDSLRTVRTVTVRELRNHGGRVLDRVAAGDTIVVTRDGNEVAELRPLAPPCVDAETLLSRWRRLPPVDVGALRTDLEEVLDPSL